MFSQAGGIIIMAECKALRPPSVMSCKALSKLAESDSSGWMMGRKSENLLPQTPCTLERSRARIRLRLPRMVLISPLWAIMRNG